MVSRRAIGVVSRERLLGQDIQPREQPQSLVEVEVIDVASAFLVQELEGQQREQGAGSGNHCGAGIVSLGDESLEVQASQQWQEQEDTCDPSSPGLTGCEIQLPTIGDRGEFWTALVFARFPASGTSRSIANEKGGGLPVRQLRRNCETNDRRARGRYPNLSATWFNERPSTKIARSAS
jgi:hypothetical protein